MLLSLNMLKSVVVGVIFFIKKNSLQIIHLYRKGSCTIGEELLSLLRGPSEYVTSFSGYIINGYRFHTQDR